MLAYIVKNNVKFLLTGIITGFICIYLHAEESVVFYGNVSVYGKEFLYAKQTTESSIVKKATKIKKKAPVYASVANETAKQEPKYVVFPVFPFESSSSSFSQGGHESLAISPQPRLGGHKQEGKACRVNTCTDIKNSDLSIYSPKQRQKLSIAATQCGELISFGINSPPVLS